MQSGVSSVPWIILRGSRRNKSGGRTFRMREPLDRPTAKPIS